MSLKKFLVWRDWINLRNKRCWLLCAAIVYSLLGFLLAPWLLKTQLPELSQQFIQRTATIEQASFNPWSLGLQVDGLEVTDSDDSTLFSAASLRVNLQLRSLFRLALVFNNVELQQPLLYLTRYDLENSNISRLLDDISGPEEVAAEDNSEPFKLIIDSLLIDAGKVRLTDMLPKTDFTTTLGPIDVSLANFSTLLDDSGEQQISIKTETGGQLSWTGDLTINPLRSTGQLKASGSTLPLLYLYMKDQLNFELENCCLDVQLNYSVYAENDGSISARIDNLYSTQKELLITAPTGEELLKLPELSVNNATLQWPEAIVHIEELRIESPVAEMWLNTDGSLNIEHLLKEDAPTNTDYTEAEDVILQLAVPEPSETTPNEDWQLSLGKLNLDNMRLSFTDRSIEQSKPLYLSDVDLTVEDISNRPGQKSTVQMAASLDSGGALSANGEFSLLPDLQVQSQIELSAAALQAIQPWISQFVSASLDEGLLNVSAVVSSSVDETFAAQADVAVTGLRISDTVIDEPLIGWSTLEVQQLEFALDAATLDIDRIKLSDPFARLKIDEQGSTNFQSLLKPDENSDPDAADAADNNPQTSGNSLQVRIGETTIDGGSMDFADLSLPIPFGALINDFSGEISAFDSTSQQASKLEFEGTVGKYGLSTINGELNLLDPTAKADVSMLFRNISVPDLTPYSIQFVGQTIAAGKLDLDLHYRLDDRLMRGDNKVVLTKFELGEKRENPDALNLPLGLAIGLLQDVNGVIDLNLAVEGDMDDPSFSAGGLILKAFSNLITKAVAAPFKLLGALVPGLDEEDSNIIAFEPGEARLLPPEQEQLSLIAEALQQRPALTLYIYSGYDAELDTAGLQKQAAQALLDAKLGDSESDAEQLIARQQKALQKLVRQNNALGGMPLSELRTVHTDAESGQLDALAYIDDMQQRLADAQIIKDEQLIELAAVRREAMLIQMRIAGLDDSRLRTPDSNEKVAATDGRVTIELELETD
jgi:uncharacterized protein involved in outer membrane biogenesis